MRNGPARSAGSCHRRLTDAELTAWQPLFDNAKKIRALLAKLQDLTLQIIETNPAQEQ